jgi:Fic family protein
MQGVRGRDKEPGAFRKDQNWIGRQGDTIDRARFVPPSPVILDQVLENWESYIQSSEEDPIMQVAIAHAQFEILHPFKDGNGRIGRMLIPLLLHQRQALSRPMFYLSEFLEANRDTYYDNLLSITKLGNWHAWLEFFLNAITLQAESNLRKVRAIRDLYEDARKQFVEVTHSQFAMAAVDAFFMRPVIPAPEFFKEAGFNNRITANSMLRQLESANLIKRIRDGSGRSPAVYALPRLINIAEGRSIL